MHRSKNCMVQGERYGEELSSAHHYLTLRSCLSGLGLLLERLFDVSMQPQASLFAISSSAVRNEQPSS